MGSSCSRRGRRAAVCRPLPIGPRIFNIADEIRAAPKKEAVEIVGDVLNIDCKHTRIEAPHDKESNDRAYPGKAHTATCNTPFVCHGDGMFVGTGSPQPGRPSDITNLRGSLPALGCPTDSVLDPGTPPGERIAVSLDRAMAGIQHVWKGGGPAHPAQGAAKAEALPAPAAAGEL